jgi:hypothetical protein
MVKVGHSLGHRNPSILLLASLFKRPESAVWWTKFYVKDPGTGELKRVRKSTGHTSKKLALPAALEIERVAQGVVAPGSDQSRKAKAILAEAVLELETDRFNSLSARKALAKLLELATGEAMPTYTVRSWCDEWLARKATGSSDATMARYRKSADEFCEWLGARQAKPLESITPGDGRKWGEALEASGRVGKTCEKYVKDLRAIFKAAVTEGLLSANPLSSVQVDTENSQARKPFDLAEVSRLVSASLTEEWKGLILVGCFTGLRFGEGSLSRPRRPKSAGW